MRYALIGLLLLASRSLADFSLIATVDRPSLSVGETLTYTITFNGAATGVPTPEFPKVSSFRIESGPYMETKFEIVNMRRSSKSSFAYELLATIPGTGVIGRATITYKGRQYQTQPISVLITSRGSSKTGRTTEDVFIRAYADKHQAYPGEQIVLTYKIFFAVQITNPEIVQLPRATGFWTEEFNIPQQMALRDEVIGGRSYKSGTFRKVAVFPTTSGELTIQPMTIRTKVEQRGRRRSRTSDPFFRLNRSMHTKEIKSPSVSLKIKPLPAEGKPANFDGAVGQFTIRANLDRTECEAHDAVTLTVLLRGKGNIKTLPAPRIQFPPDFEFYEPKSSERIIRSRANISGTKQFEYVLIPRVSGVQELPAVQYVYFNPQSRQYVTASTQPMILRVNKPRSVIAGEVPLPLGRKRGVESIASDIAFVKTQPGTFYRYSTSPHRTVGFWIYSVGPWFALAIFAVVYRRSSRFEAGRMTVRRAMGIAHKELAQAEKFAAGNHIEDASRSISLALQTLLATRLDCDPGSLTSETLVDYWQQHHLNTEMLEQTLKVMQECDRSRFTAGDTGAADISRMVDEAKVIISGIESMGRGEQA